VKIGEGGELKKIRQTTRKKSGSFNYFFGPKYITAKPNQWGTVWEKNLEHRHQKEKPQYTLEVEGIENAEGSRKRTQKKGTRLPKRNRGPREGTPPRDIFK